mgnify:CR=1 FL=1
MRFLIGLLAATAMASAAAAGPLALPHSGPAPTPASPLIQPIADAAADKNPDDADFLFRLGMMEGHLIIGHEMLVNNQTALALPHFGHPVRELYDDVGPYLGKHHFPGFDKQLITLEAAVTAAPKAKDTDFCLCGRPKFDRASLIRCYWEFVREHKGAVAVPSQRDDS